jgi:hypothetical protein
MLFCVTCEHFAKRDTYNSRLYLGRCSEHKMTVMICPPEPGTKDDCDRYKRCCDAEQKIKDYKAWREKHPITVYDMKASEEEEAALAKPVPKSKRRGKRK